MGKAQLEQLEKYGNYISVPKGISMRPMIRNRQDAFEIQRLEKAARRYDIVMYTRGKNDQGVIHRVYRVREKDYVIFGDNCWQKEIIPKEKVAGIAVRFCRKGKWHDMQTSRGYRLYAWLWTNTLFLRRPVLWVRDLGKRAVRKMRKVFARNE